MKNKIKKAISVLIGRSLVGILISLGSMALIFSHLSSEQYGPIVVGQAVFFYVITIASAGMDTVVLRSGKELDEDEISRIYLVSLILMSVAIVASLLIMASTMADTVDMRLMSLLSLAYVVRGISAIPASRLESKIEFHRQAIGDFISQIVYVIILYLLFSNGMAVYSVVYAYLGAAITYSAFVLKANLVRPKIPVDWGVMFSYVKQGISIQSNAWIWQFKDFALPMLIKEAGGMGLVGLYGLANQLMQRLSFVRQIIWRLSIPAIAHSKQSPQLSSEIKRASEIQVFVVSVLVLIIGLIIFWLEQYGASRWQGISEVFPALATNMILNSIFSLTCAGLVVWGCFRELVIFHVLFVVMVLGVMFILSPIDPVRAIWLAELAGCAAYVYLAGVAKNKLALLDYQYSILLSAVVILAVIISAEVSPIFPILFALVLIITIRKSRAITVQIYRELMPSKGMK